MVVVSLVRMPIKTSRSAADVRCRDDAKIRVDPKAKGLFMFACLWMVVNRTTIAIAITNGICTLCPLPCIDNDIDLLWHSESNESHLHI